MSANVEIEYCVPCGHLDRALDTQRAILERFDRDIDGVRLKTGHDGVFTIRVDGEEIYNNTQGFDLDQIIGGAYPVWQGVRENRGRLFIGGSGHEHTPIAVIMYAPRSVS